MESQETLTLFSFTNDEFNERESRFINGLVNLKPVGRKNEHKVLKGAFDRVVAGKMSEVVFIHGESGVGKSATAALLRKRVEGKKHKQRRGYFISGKFDQLQTNTEPYSAIVELFSQLCELIDDSHDKVFKAKVQTDLRSNLTNDEAGMLMKLIPNLTRLVGNINASTISTDSLGPIHSAFLKFKLLCRKFLSSVATDKYPVVLFVDDLQWADDGSMDVFLSLCSDTNLKHCLLIGAYRDDEDYCPPNFETLIPCTDLLVSPLDLDDVNSIVVSLTAMKPSQTQPLAEVVYTKTRGNAHFVKLFLETLFVEKLLSFSHEKKEWVWDVAQVMAEANDASNVLMAAKIDRLSMDVQEVLKLASCLGFVFDLDVLQVIVVGEHENVTGKKHLPGSKLTASETSKQPLYRDVLLKLLGKAKMHALLVDGRRPYSFAFAHDKIFECVYTSLPTGLERQQLHTRIGRQLLKHYPDDQYVQFQAVDQLNQGSSSVSDVQECLSLARLNLHVAKVAYEKSAYDRSATYVASGLSLLSDDLWGLDYELALDLHTMGAEAVAVYRDPERLVNKVLLHARCLPDKIPVYLTLLNYYGWQNRLDEALDTGIGLVKLLGEKIPRNAGKIQVAWEFTMAKRAVSKTTVEELLSRPTVQDRATTAVMGVIHQLCEYAYLTNGDLFLVCCLRGLRLSLRHGINPETSPPVFATYGTILNYARKHDEAARWQEFALKLLEIHNGKQIRATTILVVHGLGLHARLPLEQVYEPLLEGLDRGLEYGNIGHGLACANMAAIQQWMIGTPLPEVESLMDRFIQIMKGYNRANMHVSTCTFHQRVLNLLNRSDNPLLLTGSAMNQDEHIPAMQQNGNEVGLFYAFDHICHLNCLFEDWGCAQSYHNKALKCQEALKSLQLHIVIREHKFFSALLHFVMYQKSGNRRQRKIGLQILKEMKGGQADGCPNYDCYIPILETEIRITNLPKEEANASYWKSAANCKYVQLRALAHERAASVMHEQFSDDDLAKQHLEAAKRHYTEWGAVAKVRHVEKKLDKMMGI